VSEKGQQPDFDVFRMQKARGAPVAPVAGEQLRIRCDVNGGPAVLTFDTVSNQMKSEAVSGVSDMGQIVGVSDKEVQFVLLKPDQGHARYRYMREEGRIYFQNDFERLVAAERCSSVPLRENRRRTVIV
jgi:hypothetical protein